MNQRKNMNCKYCSGPAKYRTLGLCVKHYNKYLHRVKKNYPHEDLSNDMRVGKETQCKHCGKPRDYSTTNILCVDCRKQYQKAIYLKRRDKASEYYKRYREEHKEEIRKRQSKWWYEVGGHR